MKSGTLTKIDRKEKSGKKYALLEIDGDLYSCWDEKLLYGLHEGSVDYDWRQSGNFKKITDIKNPSGPEIENKDARIVRMSCLRTAGEIISGERLDLKLKIEKVLDTSKIFEKYVVTGEIPEEYKILLERYGKKKTPNP